MIKLFKKPQISFLLFLFQQIWTLIFVYFWPHAESPKKKEKKKKKLIQISGERRAERWPDRQETDILAKNHTRGRSNKPNSMNFFLSFEFEFWTKDHACICYVMLFNIYFFICYLGESWPMLRHYQGHSFTHLILTTTFLS